MNNLLAGHRVDVPLDDVFRMMGYPDASHVSPPVSDLCRAQIRRLEELITPWGGSTTVAIERIDEDTIQLTAERRIVNRRLSAILRGSTALEICLATVGSRVSAEVGRLVAAGEMLEALALDAAASAATSSCMSQVRARVCGSAQERNWGATLAYGPGYAGWRTEDTVAMFSFVAGEAVPVSLNDQLMMTPQKSLLNVIGIGPARRGTPREVVPCRLCDLERCAFRRIPHRPQRRR